MNPELPDYLRSRAILIGTSVYQDKRFPRLPAVANSLQGLKEILIDRQLCGWPPDRVETLLNQADRGQLITDLRRWARDTTEVLLAYYVGHGTIAPRGELCLALTSTTMDDPDVTGIEYRYIRSALMDSPARIKVVILDCCYSGRAIQALSGPEDTGHSTAIRGAYVITASDHAAHVPPLPEQTLACTSFTGELLELIRTGIPGCPDTLTLNMIYAHLRARLRSCQLPDPNRYGTDTAGDFGFTRNAAYLPEPIERFPRPEPLPPARRPWRRRIPAIVGAVMLAAAVTVYGMVRINTPGQAATCGPATTGSKQGPAGGKVVIGSANFPESQLIAQIYADALEAKGIDVTTEFGITSRELYYPEICSGRITIIPEYNGALLTTSVNPDSNAVTTTEVDTALQGELPPTLMILNPSPAQDKDSVTVTQETAARYNLSSITDLGRIARNLVIGGPSEFPYRQQGLLGLLSVYGLTFKGFQPLDDSGPESIDALIKGKVQVADIFTTDPEIKADNLVQLSDPKNLFTAENIVPLVYKPGVNPVIIAALNAVSARLTTTLDLQSLDAQVMLRGVPAVASEWLAQVGLSSTRPAPTSPTGHTVTEGR